MTPKSNLTNQMSNQAFQDEKEQVLQIVTHLQDQVENLDDLCSESLDLEDIEEEEPNEPYLISSTES
uniref:Uncharacterized protein n=1 Tax=Manihot esculenta TaxID=3983 RepID=A0A199UCB6_MANES